MLLIFVDELISTPKIIKFLPVPPLGYEKNPFPSNPIPYPEYVYLSISTFSYNLTAPNNELLSIGKLSFLVESIIS